MNPTVIANFKRLKYTLYYLPLGLILCLMIFLFLNDAVNAGDYTIIQKDCFIYFNARLGQFPETIYNLTQIGDALIFLSLLSVFFFYAPAVWDALLPASLLSLIASSTCKNLFSVPRPAAVLDADTFIIIGQKLTGHNSLPSGHSITIFTTLTILLFAFMPQKSSNKSLWIFLLMGSGLLLASTRVGVGAHYPLDVLAGSLAGYFCGVTGIFIGRKYKTFSLLNDKKYVPVFILLLLFAGSMIFMKIREEHLPVYFLTLGVLIYSLYKATDVYIKR
jgi:membrane-associated phospholipid phosphatase